MKNPKTWNGATPWGYKGRNDKSGPDKNLSAHGRPTMVKASSMDFPASVPKSGGGHKGLGHPSFEGIGNPYPMSSDRKEMSASFSKPSKIDKSEPKVPATPVKWHRSGRYNMMDGQHGTLEGAAKFNAKEKAR